MVKMFKDMFSYFDTIRERDRHQTDIQRTMA